MGNPAMMVTGPNPVPGGGAAFSPIQTPPSYAPPAQFPTAPLPGGGPVAMSPAAGGATLLQLTQHLADLTLQLAGIVNRMTLANPAAQLPGGGPMPGYVPGCCSMPAGPPTTPGGGPISGGGPMPGQVNSPMPNGQPIPTVFASSTSPAPAPMPQGSTTTTTTVAPSAGIPSAPNPSPAPTPAPAPPSISTQPGTVPTSATTPLDTNAPNYRWAPDASNRITSIPMNHGMNGIAPLPNAPQMTKAHWNGADQRPQINPSAIIIHSTAGGTGHDAQGWKRSIETDSTGQGAGIGAQYYILKSGEIVEVQSPDRKAHHANAPATNGQWNDHAVGIEIVNGNQDPNGRETYTPEQMESVRKLTRHLATRFQIPRENVVMHRQMQPDNRTDPVGFPWHHFLQSLGTNRPYSGPIYQTGPNDPGVPMPNRNL